VNGHECARTTAKTAPIHAEFGSIGGVREYSINHKHDRPPNRMFDRINMVGRLLAAGRRPAAATDDL
jgi:hypothetical protein